MKSFARTLGALSFAMVAPLLANAEQDRMLVPLTDVSTNKIPYMVAADEGIFRKYGVPVEFYLTPHAAIKGDGDGMNPNWQLVMDPETRGPISTGGGVGLIKERVEEGGDRVILATTGNFLNYFVYARPGIDSLEDLKGKRISASGRTSCTGSVVQMIANRMGWEFGTDLILEENAERRIDKMLEGAYDAVIVPELPNVYAQKLGLKPIADLSTWNVPFVCSGISASKSWLADENNREMAKNFIKAVTEAIAVMKKDPSTVYRALEKWYGVEDIEDKKMMYETVAALPDSPYPSVDGINVIMKTWDSPEMRKFAPEDFYDDSLMREIEASGFIEALHE